MENIERGEIQNQREFSRVNARVPLEVRLIPPDQRDHIYNRMEECSIAMSQLPPDVSDPLLAEWLKLFNSKLEMILALIASNQGRSELPDMRTEDICGSGLSFTTQEEYHIDDLLEIKMFIFSRPQRTLHLYGEVVQSEKVQNGFFTAVHFIDLDDNLRDEIVRFVFQKERELLRSTKE